MREIASLTKIMTCYVVLNLIEHFKLQKEITYVQFFIIFLIKK